MHSSEGEPLDLFEVVDELRDQYRRIYLIDLEGVQHGSPQLDYVQELSRDTELWVDAGIEDVDDAMDVIVAGAERVVLSTARLASAREVGRTWKLSQELVVEIRFRDGRLDAAATDWPATAEEIARSLRELGIGEIVLGYYEAPIDWVLVRNLAAAGLTWVLDSAEGTRPELLGPSGAAGAIFTYPPSPTGGTPSPLSRST
jgi:imidazole glycerol phosphate synthase subunit HisF